METKSYNPIEDIKNNTTSIFTRASAKTEQGNALSFGEGSPNFELSQILIEATKLALEDIKTLDDPLYHSRTTILEETAREKSKLLNRELRADENVYVQSGGTGVLSAYMHTHLRRGDEVILFEPFFLWWRTFANAGITIKYAKPLFNENKFCHAEIDFEYIRSLITPNTKLILIINPNNPDGRVWLRSELEELAKIVQENPQINVFSDEVYCRNIYDNTEFIPFCTLPDMFERTITNYSYGKEFCVTGWRLGAGCGPKHLIQPVRECIDKALDGLSIVSELSIGHCLKLANKPYMGHNTYYDWFRNDFQKRKDDLTSILINTKKFDFQVVQPMGGYTFIVSILKCLHMIPIKYYYPTKGVPESEKRQFISSIEEWETLEDPELGTDVAFSDYLVFEHGLGIIPGSGFYQSCGKTIQQQEGKSFIRFSICKKDENIEALREKLK